MKSTVEDRAVELGRYIVENDATVRTAAKQYHISKSTVHTDNTKKNVLALQMQRLFILRKNIGCRIRSAPHAV